jgi:quercetin dioxygenase-like cupin family protein
MPILRFADAPEFDLSGIRVRGLASPSRGSTESMTYRLDIAGGQHVPSHTHDHEEVSHLISGGWTVTIEGAETPLQPGDTVIVPTGVTHASYTREGEEAVILTTMPVGTVTIRPDGERVSPAWGL